MLVFSKTYYYYKTATSDYTVLDKQVSGTFDMQIPKDCKEYTIADDDPANDTYTLSSDAYLPIGIVSVVADGTIVEPTDLKAGDEMPCYAHKGGYVFCGREVYNNFYGANKQIRLLKDNTQ